MEFVFSKSEWMLCPNAAQLVPGGRIGPWWVAWKTPHFLPFPTWYQYEKEDIFLVNYQIKVIFANIYFTTWVHDTSKPGVGLKVTVYRIQD